MTMHRHDPAPEHHSGAGSSASARRQGLALLATGAVAAAGLTVLATVDPNTPGHYPTCPFLALTGYWCPGCGALRAGHALVHLDVGTALARNPLAVVAAVWLVAWYVVSWWRLLARRPRRSMVHPVWLYTLLGVVCVYWVARNVPGWTWLSPA